MWLGGLVECVRPGNTLLETCQRIGMRLLAMFSTFIGAFLIVSSLIDE